VRTSDFDYELPSQLIAQVPLEPRDHSRLMVVNRGRGSLEHRRFYQLVDYLEPGDLLVLNDSRVLPARLLGRKAGTGGKVEALLLRRLKEGLWEALVKPGKRLPEGTEVEFESASGARLAGRIIARGEHGIRLLHLSEEGLLEKVGVMPLPPYIHRPLEEAERYQTVYARSKGSVAAPTAGLHFTPQLLEAIQARGIGLAFITLHVGLDSFRPVTEADPLQHSMHKEYCEVSEQAAQKINQARVKGGRIICVGTTAVRAVEQAAIAGGPELQPYRDWSDLFILPGHRFRIVDGLITNFHLPRSTLLMLVCAFAGQDLVKRAYKEAIEHRYRFYSFGDAMLIL